MLRVHQLICINEADMVLTFSIRDIMIRYANKRYNVYDGWEGVGKCHISATTS